MLTETLTMEPWHLECWDKVSRLSDHHGDLAYKPTFHKAQRHTRRVRTFLQERFKLFNEEPLDIVCDWSVGSQETIPLSEIYGMSDDGDDDEWGVWDVVSSAVSLFRIGYGFSGRFAFYLTTFELEPDEEFYSTNRIASTWVHVPLIAVQARWLTLQRTPRWLSSQQLPDINTYLDLVMRDAGAWQRI